jgi:hypothetical protein
MLTYALRMLTHADVIAVIIAMIIRVQVRRGAVSLLGLEHLKLLGLEELHSLLAASV